MACLYASPMGSPELAPLGGRSSLTLLPNGVASVPSAPPSVPGRRSCSSPYTLPLVRSVRASEITEGWEIAGEVELRLKGRAYPTKNIMGGPAT